MFAESKEKNGNEKELKALLPKSEVRKMEEKPNEEKRGLVWEKATL